MNIDGTPFCAFGFALTRPVGRRSQTASIATAASVIAVRSAGWKYGDGSDMRLIFVTSKASREGNPIAFASSAIGIGLAHPP